MTSVLEDLVIATALFSVLIVALEVGFRFGRRAAADSDSPTAGQVVAIQGAVLGLLGLLLAFSFAAAGARFLERQDLIVVEANAIGTASLRADMLDEPHRSDLRQALKRYTQRRLELSAQLRAGLSAAVEEEIERLQARIWTVASAGVAAKPVLIGTAHGSRSISITHAPASCDSAMHPSRRSNSRRPPNEIGGHIDYEVGVNG